MLIGHEGSQDIISFCSVASSRPCFVTKSALASVYFKKMHIQISLSLSLLKSLSLSLSCGCAVVLESCRPRSRLCAWPSCYKKPGDLCGSMRAAPRKFDKGNQRYMKDFQHLSKINCMKKLHDNVGCFSSILVCPKELILPWQHFRQSTLPPLLSSHRDDPTKLRGNQPGQSSRPCKMRTAS